ncbi:MAG: hypothetical protein LBR10_12270 [Prevotellaceae bacterium]|jgi:hypothetical protein|nr:hypothetical protein [Prevotellaceae bacterium]
MDNENKSFTSSLLASPEKALCDLIITMQQTVLANLYRGGFWSTKTSFPPNFSNKTTSVAMEYHIVPQPHYLIKNKVYESRIQ